MKTIILTLVFAFTFSLGFANSPFQKVQQIEHTAVKMEIIILTVGVAASLLISPYAIIPTVIILAVERLTTNTMMRKQERIYFKTIY